MLFSNSRTERSGNRRSSIAIGLALAGAIGIAGIATTTNAAGPDDYWVLPHATLDPASSATSETIVVAGGCFWGVQAVFQHVQGVTSAVSGYSGGAAETATYGQIGRGNTGHAEAVRITYNPQEISLGELLRVFFSVATDPTQLNRQGSDIGTQYRNEIFTTTAQQAEVANAYIAQLDAAGIYDSQIVTVVSSLQTFFPAEAYHQDYLANDGAGDPHGPNIAYLRYWDYPKVEHLQALFPEYWRASPLLVATTNPDLVN